MGVSVPLRGLWFLSPFAHFIRANFNQSFRPLAGIMVLIDRTLTIEYSRAVQVSVPLRGLWFLSSQKAFTFLHHLKATFPSPCGDYGSYLWLYFGDYQADSSCFRPLAGIMVLIRTLYKCLYEAVEMAFCGADHIFSSFFVFCRKMIFKKLLRTEF